MSTQTFRYGTPEEFTVEVPDGYRLVSEPELLRLQKAHTILSDLDRCEHGRHRNDVCGQCNGPSVGNGFIGTGRRLGTTMSGKRIVVPTNCWDIESWIVP